MRNIATRYDEPKQTAPVRRTSLPAVAFSLSDTMFNAHKGEEEEEAVAGRLEIRVVDATGGATIVQTSADREPLQSIYNQFFFITNFFIVLSIDESACLLMSLHKLFALIDVLYLNF